MSYPKPTIDPIAFIAGNATVIGDVAIGAQSCVLFNATLRGDCGGRIVIGERSNVQELACLHVPVGGQVIVGDDVSVGHAAVLHGCTVGDGTLVGMGAIVLDGARIGKRCLVGAGALVTGKMDAPDGVMILGSPARVVRELTQKELDGLAENAAEYVRIGEELAREGLLDQGSCTEGQPA